MSNYRVVYGQSAKDIPTLTIMYEDYGSQTLQNREAMLVDGMLKFPDKWHVVDSCINTDGSLSVNIIFD